MGDAFLKGSVGELKANKKKAIANRCDPPHLFDMYNIKASYGMAEHGLAKFITPLVDALNEECENHLPKYIIYFPDKDFMENLTNYKIETGIFLGVTIHGLIKQIDILIDCRKLDILHKKPGAYCDEYPKIVWVRMLKRPTASANNRIFALRGKFNSILEE